MRKNTYKHYNRNLNYETQGNVFRTGSLYAARPEPSADADHDGVETIELHDPHPRVLRPHWWNHVYHEDSENYFQYSQESSSDVLAAKSARHFGRQARTNPQVDYITAARYAESESSDEHEEAMQPALLMYCNARCVFEELSGLNVAPGWSTSSSSASPSADRLAGKQPHYKANRVPTPFPNNYSIPKIDLSKGWTLPTVTELKEAQTSVSRDLIEPDEARIKKLCNWLSSGAKENEKPTRMTQSAKEARQTQTLNSYAPLVVLKKDVATQTSLKLSDLENILTVEEHATIKVTNKGNPASETPKTFARVRQTSTNPFEADYVSRYPVSDVYRAGAELATGRRSYLDSKGTTNSPVATCLPTLSFGRSRTGSDLTDSPGWWRLWRCLVCCRIK